MGSGDLNMKKSWHPQTLANQRRVAEEKRKAEEEAKRVAKIQKELREERQREEMDLLNASNRSLFKQCSVIL
ncbi:RNA-splicing factor [Coemansia sp. RSA 1200]|nr:RNA-splicing factor [Coemansia sp. RSA 1200]